MLPFDVVLRDRQQKAVREIERAIAAGDYRLMLQAPTGFGKTVTLAYTIRDALNNGQRVNWVTPRISLVGQTMEMLGSTLRLPDERVGVVQASHPQNKDAHLQLISTATLVRRREVPRCDLMIIDEAHIWYHAFEQIFGQRRWRRVPIIGLSATPWTRGLGCYYNRLITTATTHELIAEGLLSPIQHWAPSRPDLSDVTIVRTFAGADGLREHDFHSPQLGAVMSQGTIMAEVVDTWLRRGRGRKTICFAVNRAHARLLRDQFTQAGIRTGYVDYLSTVDERQAIKQQFFAGEIELVVNVALMTIGIDWPGIECIILATATTSEMRYVQMVGRGLRVAEGKSDLLLLDHGDNYERMGFAQDIHYERLDMGETPPQQPTRPNETHRCENCHFVYRRPYKLDPCPQCGFIIAQSEVVTVPGELVRVSPMSDDEERETFYQTLLWLSAKCWPDIGLGRGDVSPALWMLSASGVGKHDDCLQLAVAERARVA
jgi:superfamily II DNA or RNA helicase